MRPPQRTCTLSLPLTTLLCCLICLSSLSPPLSSAFKINKNTIELLNNGLKALVSIKRILSTIKSVNELTGQAFPGLVANRPKIRLVEKLLGVGGKTNLESAASATMQAKRAPSLGLIKIGEKPPPGLFPETLPYSLTGGQSIPGTSPGQVTTDLLTSASTLNPTVLSTSDLYAKLQQVAAAAAAASSSSSSTSGSSSNNNNSPSGSTSQLISAFSNTDLKTSGSALNHRHLVAEPSAVIAAAAAAAEAVANPSTDASSPLHYHMFPYSFNQNVYNDQVFAGSYEPFQK